MDDLSLLPGPLFACTKEDARLAERWKNGAVRVEEGLSKGGALCTPDAVRAAIVSAGSKESPPVAASQDEVIACSQSRAEALLPALHDAARYDRKILCERAVDAREIEVALLGIDPIEASVPGEIRSQREFYDYEAKYVDEDTELLVPAPLDADQAARVRDLAVRAMQTLEGAGLGRADFLLEQASGEFWLNEMNSLPGFTEASMFPRLWEASGLPFPALLDRLVELAMERHRDGETLETLYRPG